MADLFDYLLWRGDLPMDTVPPNPVDTLILSELSYIGYEGLVPGDFLHPVPLKVVAEAFLALPDREARLHLKKDLDLIEACAGTARFGDLRMVFYRSELLEMESQFSAVTWLLPGGEALITYRGTDTTLTGWKEDFHMSFQESVPAQEKALRYLEAFARVHPTLPLMVAGHSKGGNMAVYAAARCQPELQERLQLVHNHDGPGFQATILKEPGYRCVLPKVRTFVPQSSVVGMLLEHEEPYTVVKSRQLSLLQHDPYSWEVLGGDFLLLEEVDENSQFLDGTIKTWLAQTSPQERNDFVDAVFELLTLGEVDDLRSVILPKNVLRYLRQLSTDEKMRSIIAKVFTDLFHAAVEQHRKKEPIPLPEENVQI